MGICTSCCENTSDSLPVSKSQPGVTGRQTQQVQIDQPDADTKRRLQAEAAERRLRETESRGIADPEKVKRQMKKQADLEHDLEKTYPSDREGGLRWTTG